jgi:hypothetical protein
MSFRSLVFAIAVALPTATLAQSTLSPRYNGVTANTGTFNSLTINGSGSTGDVSGMSVTATGGSTARTIKDRAADVVNVLDFGVKCDGATDNATALTAAVAKLSTGKTLYFPPASNKCLTSAAISLPPGSAVYAHPGTVTLAPTASSTANPLLVAASGVSGALVYGLTLDGGGATFASANTLATVFNASSVVFDRVTVQNTRGIGVLFSTNVTNSGVRSSTFTNVGNYWRTSGVGTDQKQGIAFCCGAVLSTSAAQSGAGTGLIFSATTGVAVGQLVSGTGITPGSYVTAVTSTSVTLSQSTYTAVASGTGITFSSNSSNFVRDTYFFDIGLDAVSAANQIGFVSTGNRYVSVGGQYSNGGAAVYAASSDRLTLAGETVLGTFGNGLDVYRTANVSIGNNNVSAAGGAGISYAAGSGASILNNVSNNNNQGGGSSSLIAGITVGSASGEPPVANVTVAGNIATDTQATKTQTYGFQLRSGSTYSNIWVDQNNQFNGNATSALGQLATSYSAPTASLGYVSQIGSGGNTGVALLAAGTGGIQVGSHDGTAAGGNPIGTYAVDLCTSRQSTAHVASADHSGCLWGSNNTAAGQFSVVGGTWSSAQGPGSAVFGQFAQDRFRYGADVWASGLNTTSGDSQVSRTVLRAITTSTTAKRLTADGNGNPGTQNTINLPQINFPANQQSIYQCSVRVVATNLTNVGNFLSYHEPMATLYRTTTAATTTLVTSGSPITKTVGTAGSIALAADTTNAGLAITWTAPNADTWHVVAGVDCTEAF